MVDEEQAHAFGRLEALIEAGHKTSAERAEKTEKAAAERHSKLAQTVADLTKSHQRLVNEVEQVKAAAGDAVKIAQRSGHDLSEHIARDDATTLSIAAHVGKIDKSLVHIQASTTGQDIELASQTKMLKHIRAVGPIVTAIASAIAAYFAARGH